MGGGLQPNTDTAIVFSILGCDGAWSLSVQSLINCNQHSNNRSYNIVTVFYSILDKQTKISYGHMVMMIMTMRVFPFILKLLNT